ncbi:heavy metal response regulator transcription factor [Halodesulfovibrio aestuarii]|uniref:Two-component system, OmpR family, copper resistance phosphate regulon response regulator CusR n=1 Tax=Halodesulfovibrio aestuarii TaxID=126333 RepID=A0A8G2C7V3_9BACT|nr:heavy metal response regulator transcription factor [Halodesulfovibrio aestuarii]SHI71130.1 two-component system, OmpR family, copper resistance phosphate regulon response regulator CusR [Halodesulfovibrio aestuarii]
MTSNATKLLLVEDQETAATYIAKGLREEGFVVDVAYNGPDGLHYLLTEEYSLAILDIMLPGIDGLTILETAKKADRTPAVLFLTARDGVEDRVRGLELGADDYLVKPFAFAELLARIRALLRRCSPIISAETDLTVGDLTLNLLTHQATRADKVIDLTPKEFALLQLFMRRKGEVLTRTVLAEQLWGINFDCDTNVVDVAVSRLRIKIDADATHKLIHTQRGVGYVLKAEE